MAPLVCSAVVIPFSPFSSPSPFSLSSPLQQSSSHHDEYRVLEVEIAVLNGGSRASAKLWIYHGERLVAKVNNVRGPNSAWNHKFLFALTDDFLRDEDSSFFIDIYNGPILGGLLGKKKFMGTAKCCINNVLSGMEADEKNATCCTVPISTAIAGDASSFSSAMNLNLKLRLWEEVLHYMSP